MSGQVLADGLQFDSGFFWHVLFHPSADFLGGLWRTVYISVVAQLLGVLLGLFIALLKRARSPWVRVIPGFYIWVIRGTPLLVQLIIAYNGLAAIGLYRFDDITVAGLTFPGVIQAAIITLAINESAYMAEIIRAGIESVNKGQMEAALAGGMTNRQAMRWIILPQALRVIIPPLGNNFNSMMKTTSVLSVIGVNEMFLSAQEVSSTTFRTFEIFIAAALYYLALTTVWSLIQSWIEGRLNASAGLTRPPSVWSRLFGGSRGGAAAPELPVLEAEVR